MSRHGGNMRELAKEAGRTRDRILDFSANINPLGPPPWLRQVVNRHLEEVTRYPDPDCHELIATAAEALGVAPGMLIAANGTSELLFALPRCMNPGRALIVAPAYVDYAPACELAGIRVEYFILSPDREFRPDMQNLGAAIRAHDLVFIGRPNNPTGITTGAADLRELMRSHPLATFVIDEAFIDFCAPHTSLLPDLPENAVLLRSMTKFFAIPGLRLGLAAAPERLAGIMRKQVTPWSVNCLAQQVGIRALRDHGYAVRTRETTARLRQDLASALGRIPDLRVYPGTANFLLLRLTGTADDAAEVQRRLLKNDGIAIRTCGDYEGLDMSFLRVAVRNADENARLVQALDRALHSDTKQVRPRARAARARLMLQGTGSNVGKSLMVTAFCRILLQDGFAVAPFKAQNMALNSFVTADGCEMGRAQVLQAQACRLAPDVRMNPILLKPCSDTGCQVVCMGHPAGRMRSADYMQDRSQVFQVVTEAFDSLAAEHEIILLEGAGSPAEVNLRQYDIVNMRMARHARSPVLLVGDIDRGGVYASFIGSMAVMEEWERALVRGFLVNMFRGDACLLETAHAYVSAYTGRPVVGVVPFIHDHGLPEEDAVSFKAGALGGYGSAGPGSADAAPADFVDIAVLDLPHISNFTDIDPLRIEPDVRLRVVRKPGDLGSPDALIIPGSKNVINDIYFLQAQGLWRCIREIADRGKAGVVGIYGGFQMLGESIADPEAVESSGRTESGLGLIPMHTCLSPDKTLLQARATHRPSGHALRGYEIHHGHTRLPERLEPVIVRRDNEPIGFATEKGNVWGTYLHGVFDADEFRRWFIDDLRKRKGIAPQGRVLAVYDIEPAIDRLADMVRANTDLPTIKRIMGLA